MSLRPAILSVLLLLPGGLFAGTLTCVLYAVDARTADQFSAELAGRGAELAEHLQALKAAGKADTPVEFSSEFRWSATIDLADGKDFEFSRSFTAEGETLKRDKSESRFLGYKATCRAHRLEDGSARLQLIFEWTPTFRKVIIPEAGEDAWTPEFHTLKTDTSHSVPKDEHFVAAMWRTDFALTAEDEGTLRQLYLVAHWTEDPAP